MRHGYVRIGFQSLPLVAFRSTIPYGVPPPSFNFNKFDFGPWDLFQLPISFNYCQKGTKKCPRTSVFVLVEASFETSISPHPPTLKPFTRPFGSRGCSNT